MAPRGAESEFGLQGWIDALRLKQIFLIVSVPLRMRHDLLGFATSSDHFFLECVEMDCLIIIEYIEGIYPLGGCDNKTLYFSANRYYYNNVLVIISLFFSLSHLLHRLCTVKIFHRTIDIFSKVADSTSLVSWLRWECLRAVGEMPGRGMYSWEFLVGVCRPVLQILTLFQTKKMSFSTPFFRLDCSLSLIFPWDRRDILPLMAAIVILKCTEGAGLMQDGSW